jgi:hypothetical protein
LKKSIVYSKLWESKTHPFHVCKTIYQYRNKSRRTVCFDSADNLVLQRRENNKGAAKKARERKRIYMELLEQVV